MNELGRDGERDKLRGKTGLPLATYFSGPKAAWILDSVDGAREKAEKRATSCSGTSTRWCIWNLTGGTDGGVHITDVTNASRTLLMNLETLDWDDEILDLIGVPRAMLPQIKASSEVYGEGVGELEGIPIADDLGDQQAALFGQTCFSVGEAKNTYGTRNFLLLNTSTEAVPSKRPADDARLQDRRPARGVLPRGAIAITGALVQWLEDNIGLVTTAPEIESLAKTVDDNGGVYFVPRSRACSRPTGRTTPAA